MREQIQSERYEANITLFYNLLLEYRSYLEHLDPDIFTYCLDRIQNQEQFQIFFRDIYSNTELFENFYQVIYRHALAMSGVDDQFNKLVVDFLNLLLSIMPLLDNKSIRDNE